MIPSSRPKLSCKYTLSQSAETIPFTAAHTYIAHIWQYPPPSPGSAQWLSIVCNTNVLSRVTGIRGRKPRNIFLYRTSCEAWGKNSSNLKSFNSNSKYTAGRVRHHRCRTFEMFGVSSDRICLRIDGFKINCCQNILFIIWFLYVYHSITLIRFGEHWPDATWRNLFICW